MTCGKFSLEFEYGGAVTQLQQNGYFKYENIRAVSPERPKHVHPPGYTHRSRGDHKCPLRSVVVNCYIPVMASHYVAPNIHTSLTYSIPILTGILR